MPRQRQTLPRARRVMFEALESRHLLATVWRNPVDAIDVNNDGQVGAFDALDIINQLNTVGTYDLPAIKPADEPFLDPTGDNVLTAFDALAVINHLNSRQAGAYVLQELAGRIADQQSITITAGTLPAGARTYRLLVQPQFDVSDTQSAMEDLFAVYLLNPATGQTVIDAGTAGSSLFTLRGAQATVHNGLVQWDGTHLSIDLSQIAAETLELRLQLLNPDADSGSKITITPVSNLIDPLGVPRSPGTLRSQPTLPAAAAADANTYLQMPTLRAELENPIYNQATGRFTAEVRLANDTEGTVTNGIVRLPGVSVANVVNASGVIGTVPYWNFASVIGATGIAPGAKSGWLKIELSLNDQSFLWRPDARGYTSTEHLAQMGVFSTNFAEQERQVFHMQLTAGESFLTLPMRSAATTTATGAAIRLFEPNGEQDYSYPDKFYDAFHPHRTWQTGDYQFEMTAKVAGDYAIAFQKLDNLPELTIGSELIGYIDPRLAPKVFAFQGTAGQRLVFENRHPVGSTQNMNWQVIEAQSGMEATFIDQKFPGGNLEVELDFAGLHYLILRGSGSNQFVPYDYILRSPAKIEVPLTFGIAQDAFFGQFNETRAYSFTGTPGQRVVMDMLTKSSSNVTAYLINPNGVQLPLDQFGGQIPLPPFVPFLIDVAGTWKVVLQGDNSESFVFRMQNVADLSAMGQGTTVSADVNPIRSDYFRIPAVRGERLTLVNSSHGSVLTQVYSPAGGLLTPIGFHQFQVNETGDQLLRIYTQGNGTYLYNFTLQIAIDPLVTQTGLDVDHTGTLNPGTTTIGTFLASAGTPLMFDRFALVSAPITYSVRITGLNFDQTFTSDSNVVTLAHSGEYTVTAINPGATNIPFGFRIVDLDTAPWLTHDERIETTFATPGKTFIRRVEGRAGEKLLLGSLDSSPLDEVTIKLHTEAGVGTNWFAHPNVEDYDFVATKTHYLTIEQEYADLSDLRLQAALTAEAQALPMDTSFSGTLGPDGGFQLYKFDAQRRDNLILDTLSMTNSLTAGVLNNNFEILDLNEPTRFYIYETGTNYLWLRPWAAADSSYTLEASFASDTATPIALDTVVNGTLSAGESRNYEIAVAAGALLLFEGLDVANPAHVNIFAPGGYYVQFNIDTRADKLFFAELAGKYKITVSNSSQPFSFRVSDARNAPLLPLNTDLQGTVVADGQARIWRFPATDGQRLFVDSNASASLPFQGSMSLFSPFGSQLASTSAQTNNDLNVSTVNVGDHYLVITASSTFNYDLRVRTSETIVIPLTLGSTVAGVLQDPADTVEYVFQGTRGQHIHLEGLTNAAFRLVHPNGFVQPTTEGFTMLLPTTGEYRVRVFSFNNQINMDYRFQIADVATLPLVPLNTPISGSTTQGEWFMYRLPAAVGDRIAFDSQYYSGPTLNQSWRLISPEATFAFIPVSPFIDGDRTVTLIDDGNYVLVVRLPAAADYAFQVNTLTNPAVIVAGLNQTYSGAVVNSDVVNVPFTGTAGQRVLLDVLDNATLPPARLLGPDGSVVVLNNNDAGATSDRLFVLPVSGTYQLEISAAGSPTPRNYRFRLLNVSALPLTPLDTPFAVNLSLPYEGNVWAFEATAGDQLAIELGLAQISAGFRVIQPDGRQSLTQSIGQLPKILEISQTGRHYLVMDGQGITPFSEIGHIWNIHNLPLITSEDPITVHFTNRDWHFYSFDLRAGDRVYFTPTTTPPTLLQFSLTGPRGLTETVSLDKTTNPNGFTVSQSGRYTLILQHASTTPIDFTFQIHMLPLREVFGVARE